MVPTGSSIQLDFRKVEVKVLTVTVFVFGEVRVVGWSVPILPMSVQ